MGAEEGKYYELAVLRDLSRYEVHEFKQRRIVETHQLGLLWFFEGRQTLRIVHLTIIIQIYKIYKL